MASRNGGVEMNEIVESFLRKSMVQTQLQWMNKFSKDVQCGRRIE